MTKTLIAYPAQYPAHLPCGVVMIQMYLLWYLLADRAHAFLTSYQMFILLTCYSVFPAKVAIKCRRRVALAGVCVRLARTLLTPTRQPVSSRIMPVKFNTRLYLLTVCTLLARGYYDIPLTSFSSETPSGRSHAVLTARGQSVAFVAGSPKLGSVLHDAALTAFLAIRRLLLEALRPPTCCPLSSSLIVAFSARMTGISILPVSVLIEIRERFRGIANSTGAAKIGSIHNAKAYPFRVAVRVA